MNIERQSRSDQVLDLAVLLQSLAKSISFVKNESRSERNMFGPDVIIYKYSSSLYHMLALIFFSFCLFELQMYIIAITRLIMERILSMEPMGS